MPWSAIPRMPWIVGVFRITSRIASDTSSSSPAPAPEFANNTWPKMLARPWGRVISDSATGSVITVRSAAGVLVFRLLLPPARSDQAIAVKAVDAFIRTVNTKLAELSDA